AGSILVLLGNRFSLACPREYELPTAESLRALIENETMDHSLAAGYLSCEFSTGTLFAADKGSRISRSTLLFREGDSLFPRSKVTISEGTTSILQENERGILSWQVLENNFSASTLSALLGAC